MAVEVLITPDIVTSREVQMVVSNLLSDKNFLASSGSPSPRIASLIVVGSLVLVWSKAKESSSDGWLEGYTVGSIDAIVGFVGFGAAMAAAGMLDVQIGGICVKHSRDVKAQKKDVVASSDDGFERFWKAYPKKRSRGYAMAVWKKINPSEKLIDRIMDSLERLKASDDWKRDGGQFIPYPASWLNGMGWEDVVELDKGRDPVQTLKSTEEMIRRKEESERMKGQVLTSAEVRKILSGVVRGTRIDGEKKEE